MKKLLLFCAAALVLTGCFNKGTGVLNKVEYALSDSILLTDSTLDKHFVEITFEYPTKMAADSALAAVQNSIITELFGGAFVKLEPNNVLEAYAAMLHTEYLNTHDPIVLHTHDEYADGEEDIFTEMDYLSGCFRGEVPSACSYQIERYVKEVETEGFNYRKFINFSTLTGAVLHQEDIFVEGFEEALKPLLIQGLINCYNEEIDEEAGDVAISTEKELGKIYSLKLIAPNDNFYFDEEGRGIYFVFNRYDIGNMDYEAEALLAWDDIRPFVREGFAPVEEPAE